MLTSNHLDFENPFLVLDDAFGVEWRFCHKNIRALLLNELALFRVQVDRADVAFLVKAVDFVIIADDFDQRDGALNLEIFTSSKDGMLPRNVYFLFTLWLRHGVQEITAHEQTSESVAFEWFFWFIFFEYATTINLVNSYFLDSLIFYVHIYSAFSGHLDLVVVHSCHLLSLVLDELGGILLINWTVQELKFRLEILRKEISALCTARWISWHFVLFQI